MSFSPIRLAAALVVLLFVGGAHAADGVLELGAIDRDTGKPIAVQVHLLNAKTKKPVKIPGVPNLGDHFVFFDKVQLKLPVGSYQFVMERGPEYLVRSGHFTIENFANDRKTVDMKRFVEMAKEGWYAGDLDVWRSERELPLLMRAEDLYVASLLTSTNGHSAWKKQSLPEKSVTRFEEERFYSLMGAEDARAGNFLAIPNLKQPLKPPATAQSLWPSSLLTAAESRRQGGWNDAAALYSWDLPLWIAAGKLDSVRIANRHLLRDRAVNHEGGGRERDQAMYPGMNGNGRWSLDIYYHLLNCGLRLPPTAGSGSGWTPSTTAAAGTSAALKAAASANTNPVGYNRVYVYIDGELTWEKWWEGLRAGRCVVTNGPLIRPHVEGQPPGYVFQADAGKTVELEIGLTLSTRDRVSYLEVVKDGLVEHEVRLEKWKESGGRLPPVKFSESGWFLVRAVTDESNTYRYATTAPYYVEIGYRPRISRKSAQFFVDWCRERMQFLQMAKLDDEKHRQELLGYWRRAEEYWQGLAAKATVE